MGVSARTSKKQTSQGILPLSSPTRLLQRQCACDQRLIPGAKCEACRHKGLSLQGCATGKAEPSSVPPIVHKVLRFPGQALDRSSRVFMESTLAHEFSQVQVHASASDRLQKPIIGQRKDRFQRVADQVAQSKPEIEHAYSGKSDCSPTWFGDTSPEVDPTGSSFTGRVIVKYNDPVLKDPCVRECVEQHESVHVKHLTPIVKKIHACDAAAGGDWEKKGKCNEMANRELQAIHKRSECEAYRKSFTCLTLKILDAKDTCSKSPHREEIQKHRGYEACEMKRYCAEAGTPELGIPSV